MRGRRDRKGSTRSFSFPGNAFSHDLGYINIGAHLLFFVFFMSEAFQQVFEKKSKVEMNTVELRSKCNTLRIHMGEGSMLMATWAIIQQPHYVLVTILRIPFLLK